MRFLIKFIKRCNIKFKLFMRNRYIIETYREKNSYEEKAFAIFRKLIRGNDSKFTIAPVSGKRYIVNSKLGIFVILDDAKLQITNHAYHYEMTLSKDDALKLTRMFNRKVENNTILYENEIKSNNTTSLSKILEELDN